MKPRFEQDRDHRNAEAIFAALQTRGRITGGVLHPQGSGEMFQGRIEMADGPLFVDFRARDTHYAQFLKNGLRMGVAKYRFARAQGVENFRVITQWTDRCAVVRFPDVELKEYDGFQRDRDIKDCYPFVLLPYRDATKLWDGTVCEHSFEHQGAR